jgi:hypothetical protein
MKITKGRLEAGALSRLSNYTTEESSLDPKYVGKIWFLNLSIFCQFCITSRVILDSTKMIYFYFQVVHVTEI